MLAGNFFFLIVQRLKTTHTTHHPPRRTTPPNMTLEEPQSAIAAALADKLKVKSFQRWTEKWLGRLVHAAGEQPSTAPRAADDLKLQTREAAGEAEEEVDHDPEVIAHITERVKRKLEKKIGPDVDPEKVAEIITARVRRKLEKKAKHADANETDGEDKRAKRKERKARRALEKQVPGETPEKTTTIPVEQQTQKELRKATAKRERKAQKRHEEREEDSGAKRGAKSPKTFSDLERAAKRLEKLKVEKTFASGRMATSVRLLKGDVVRKQYNLHQPDRYRRFHCEVAILSHLQKCPFVPQLLGLDLQKGVLYETFVGEKLKEPATKERAEILRKLDKDWGVRKLKNQHKGNFVRDPATGNLKVIDFGSLTWQINRKPAWNLVAEEIRRNAP